MIYRVNRPITKDNGFENLVGYISVCPAAKTILLKNELILNSFLDASTETILSPFNDPSGYHGYAVFKIVRVVRHENLPPKTSKHKILILYPLVNKLVQPAQPVPLMWATTTALSGGVQWGNYIVNNGPINR